MTRDPFGAAGDFITAPEISQMFGELIGLWAAAVWRQMGSPENIRLIELGPGRGTMMADALRAAKVVPDFRAAIVVHLVEISPALRAAASGRRSSRVGVPVLWHTALDDVPDGPGDHPRQRILRRAAGASGGQAATTAGTSAWSRWTTTAISRSATARARCRISTGCCRRALRDAPPGAIFEWRADSVALEIGRRVARSGGAALVIDYGHVESAVGDTVQAVGEHAYVDPLVAPGLVDLTAHVDFQSLARGRRKHRRAHPRPAASGRIPAPARHRDPRRRAEGQRRRTRRATSTARSSA